MNRLLLLIFLLPISSLAEPPEDSRCMPASASPFVADSNFKFEHYDTRTYGMMQLMAGNHKDFVKEALDLIVPEHKEVGGCTKSKSLVVYTEPSKYSDKECGSLGNLIDLSKRVSLADEESIETALKKGARWYHDIMTDHYPECHDSKKCSLASTTKFQVTADEVVVTSQIVCVPKRKKKVNRIDTTYLHEWTCNN